MSVSAFNPADFVSDKPVSQSEKEVLDKVLDKVKFQLFYDKNAGFLASLVATINFDWDRTIDTACTNGVWMAWNPEFFLSLTPKRRVTVLAHEAWHIAFQHIIRGVGKDAEIYNEAADHVINLHLQEHGYDMTGFPYLMDPRFKGMDTDTVYDILYKERQAGIPGLPNFQNGDFKTPGNGPESINKGMTPAQIQNKAMGNIMDAVTIARMTNQAGAIPGEIQMVIDKFLNPVIPWEEALYLFFENAFEQERSYRAINRRYADPILPGNAPGNSLEHIIYFLDISGSISDRDIVRFNSEVKHIKESFNPERLTLVTFDTKIHDIYEFEAEDEFEKIVVTGRGGTDLTDVFAYAVEHQPTAMVIFTDLYVGIPEDPKIPIIWACSGNPKAKVPFGTLISIKE
jgi:predicted metal-dependent peptidase